MPRQGGHTQSWGAERPQCPVSDRPRWRPDQAQLAGPHPQSASLWHALPSPSSCLFQKGPKRWTTPDHMPEKSALLFRVQAFSAHLCGAAVHVQLQIGDSLLSPDLAVQWLWAQTLQPGSRAHTLTSVLCILQREPSCGEVYVPTSQG